MSARICKHGRQYAHCGECWPTNSELPTAHPEASPEERTVFIAHIGRVTINNRRSIVFDANCGDKVIVNADTIYEIAREVRRALSEMPKP